MRIQIDEEEGYLESGGLIIAYKGQTTDRVGIIGEGFLYSEYMTKGWNGAWEQTISRQDV